MTVALLIVPPTNIGIAFLGGYGSSGSTGNIEGVNIKQLKFYPHEVSQ